MEIQNTKIDNILPLYHGSQGLFTHKSVKEVREESRGEYFVRRTFDIFISLSVLILTMPIMIGIAILIRLDSPGPALFWQVRMTKKFGDLKNTGAGKDRSGAMAGHPFKFVKFRTMYIDAKERFPELYKYNYTHEEISTIKFKVDNDPRVTSIGLFLRKSSLDELPNFWNVLTGDMTLVGPRPEIPEMSRYYTDEQLKKFAVPAGVTGLAQVKGRGHLSFQDTANLDALYAMTHSLKGDIEILWGTVLAVVTGKGAF